MARTDSQRTGGDPPFHPHLGGNQTTRVSSKCTHAGFWCPGCQFSHMPAQRQVSCWVPNTIISHPKSILERTIASSVTHQHQSFIFSQLGSPKFKTKVSAGLVSSEAFSPSLVSPHGHPSGCVSYWIRTSFTQSGFFKALKTVTACGTAVENSTRELEADRIQLVGKQNKKINLLWCKKFRNSCLALS